MYKKVFCVLISMLLLTGCSEGKAVGNQAVEGDGVSAVDAADQDSLPESDAESGSVDYMEREALSFPLKGETYQVEQWELYSDLSQAEISREELQEFVPGNFEGEVLKNILLVTLRLTCRHAPPEHVDDEIYLNNFRPTTRSSIEASYLPELEPDDESFLYLETGWEAIYLDIGNVGQTSYFRIDRPEDGESIVYTLGYSLSDTEYRAAEQGELYLYRYDAAAKREDLLLLYLSPERRHAAP